MKLLCINVKEIRIKLPNETIRCIVNDLVEGDVYTTRGKSFKDEDGQICYYIEGIGIRLSCRFTELLEEDTTAEKAIEKLKEEFQLN